LAGRLEAERAHPQADVFWGSEAFLTARLANEGVLAPYASPNAADVPEKFRDKSSLWTGVGLRARVLAVVPPGPGFPITSIHDLADPRLKGKVAIARPTAGSTGAQVAVLYLLWGDKKASAFFKSLHENKVTMVGGNAVVADQLAAGAFVVGLTDTDDVANTNANGGNLAMIVPDQGPNQDGTVTMPTTVALIAGAPDEGPAKKLIDALVSKQTESKLIEMKFAKWSVRDSESSGGIKSIAVDYSKAAETYSMAGRKATALIEGRNE
jgi:iron(III) transport system substrate-binding protein